MTASSSPDTTRTLNTIPAGERGVVVVVVVVIVVVVVVVSYYHLSYHCYYTVFWHCSHYLVVSNSECRGY